MPNGGKNEVWPIPTGAWFGQGPGPYTARHGLSLRWMPFFAEITVKNFFREMAVSRSQACQTVKKMKFGRFGRVHGLVKVPDPTRHGMDSHPVGCLFSRKSR